MKDMLEMFALRADEGEWRYEVDPVVHVRFGIKMLYHNTDTGAKLEYCVYPGGYVKPAHHHTHGQGLYVLEGDMLADGRVYHPGDYVWFPANTVGTHGATAARDCAFLALADGRGEMIYD